MVIQVRKKPTLKTVAAHLGVSTATVSNAFNRPTQLSKSLREKILAECEMLGYSGPSITARSLRTGKTGVIGVLLADCLAYSFTDPVATLFLGGISDTLDEAHVNMLLLPSNKENYQNTQVESIPDSFIVYGKPADSSVIEFIQRQHKPIVTVDFLLDDCPSINIDNQRASYDIAMHAIESKHDNVLILGLRLEPSASLSLANMDNLYNCNESISRCRFDGYVQALKERDIPLNPDNVWQIHDLDVSTLKTMLRGALTAPKKVDVLLCMSDKIALAAMEVAHELNIELSNSLKIVGFDGIPKSQEAGLTTVEQPIFQKGQVAARMALGQIPYESIELDTQLIIRSSS
ncbi:LacI family DNA-binding transcriptional regulator [Vibrio sp. ZSDZ34]|jgi:DNA-binding LacI/PurR family transcriptional regulator|uniref:LacI family DNA-binding transcriptional regulator n=1 Tax=Vibrio gelatinilyticus TaxID=2893468 RepID=A0A9X2AXY7_9VIBR|nr:LacI family DNA-binding transcriptional regulator [Vibrio gelatinilyticus]MCJ2376107.1 LacI family DNA-binding transcriptional regulator [Vibrio gelatinilyticus]